MTPLQFCFLLSLLCAQCWGFFSDYKLCGDPGCETLLGRVQATKDFKGPDCRFLNFRSGDAIFVYFKLSGKREDLWAGSIDKQFGYFPKDAVEVEEVYTPKEKEIELPTQELDFFCIDENGAIIEGDFSQSDNLDEQVELQGLLADDMQGLRTSEPIQVTQSTKTVDKVETSQTIVQDPFDNAKSKPTEQGGSYWIGSGLTGWLGLGAKNEEQESFKNRKIALDVNQLEENERTETASWLRGQLAGVFSFGQRSPDTAPKEPINQIKDEGLTENPKDEGLTENPKDEGSMANQKETTNTDSWLYTGIGDLLHFHQSVDENSELRIEDSGHPGTEEKIVTENPLSFSEPGERWNEGKKRENSRVEFTDGTKGFSSIENNGYDNDYKNGKPQNDGENDGYGSMYSSVLELYGEKREVENADDNSPGSFEGSHVQEPGSDTRDGSQHETTKDVQSLFSIGGISTMFGSLPSKFQQNIRDVNKDAENYDESALEMTDKAVTDGPECTHGSCFVPEEDAAEKDRRRFEEGDLLPTVQEETPLQSQSEDLHDGTAAAVALFLNRTSQVILDTTECLQDTVSRLTQFIIQVVSSLPDDLKPGPDFYGLPWEAVIVTALLGMLTMLLFTCRLYQSIKSRFYVGKERKLGQKIAELLEEKCKALETLSQCSHRYEELETALQNGGASAQASEGEDLEAMSKKLEEANAKLGEETEQLKVDLKAQKFKRLQQEETLASMQETLKSLEEESKNLKSQMEQAQTTLKIYDINGERLQKSLQAAKEENVQLLESKAQLVQEAEGWGERLSELEEEMKMCESSHKDMVEQCTSKDQHIQSLTDCLLKMRDWDSEIEDGSVQENGDASDIRQKQKVEKLISAAKVSADLKSLEEEKNRLVARLTDEVKAKEDLQGGIERLQGEKDSLQAESVMFANETQKLQKKLQIMTEMYQENELKLHRMLTVEGRERLQKEEKLSKADKKISLAAEELSTYRQRAQELEEELEKTNQAYKNQIAAHEKKAHDNWLAARAADRDLADVKRENGHLRQKLTDLQFKLEMVEKDPFALEAPGRSSFRGERSPFGPSPLGRPASETRAFLSPPTLMDGPPRLSPQFPLGPGSRVSHGPPSLTDVPVAREGPRSDSRGPGAPPGYLYPDPRLPYRRPPPPGAFLPGPLPPRGPALAEAHFNPNPTDKSAELGSTSGSLRLGLSESRDSLLSLSGEPSNAPDANTREAPPLGPPPPLAPVDLLHRRGPYGPPEFFPPRVPPMGMRGPLPPGMYPRFPPLPPHPTGYPPAGPPPDNRSGPPRRPSPPGSEHPPDNRPFSQDMI
ncbi:cTAGE family member 2 isoform X4 [Brienomyrus brachyistius]|uniref:cTAGE family member 2 isoform X4 n=1 Tax=Brienomyrus brachyistius TaxID=42636 RepID=UPI0020B2A625|nr:cTAGE family member 2 isoform X4 [Brienomyrus brachyistius]